MLWSNPHNKTFLVHFRAFAEEAAQVLRGTAGNFYVNDKSTGSVVGQQPFGGARLSGKHPILCLLTKVLDLKRILEVFLGELGMTHERESFFLPFAGTNDKAGGPHYMLKWASPQSVKQTFVPLTDVEYPYMKN